MKTAFAESGDLRSTDVLAALVALWREGASGALHFSRSGASAGFHLSAGEVTSVTSSESRFETASILLRAGKLDAATLERLSAPAGGDRALAALGAGVLTKREWRWGEKIRAVEVLSDLLTWLEGDYSFDRGAHADTGEFRLTVPRLILELFLRSRDRQLVLHYLGGADVPLARAPHFDSEFIAFGLTADAEAVVRLIDGRSTAAEIASEGTAEPFAVEKLLAALVTLGLVHPEFVAHEASPSRPAPRAEKEEEEDEEEEEAYETEEAGESEETEEVRERDEEAEAPAEASGHEPVDHREPYSELDVPQPETRASEEAELDPDLGAPRPEPEPAEDEEPEVGASEIASGYEMGEEPSIAAERMRPGLIEAEGESTVEYGSLDGSEGSDVGGPGERDLSAHHAREPEAESRLPLDFATGVGSSERPRTRSSRTLLWLFLALAAGVAAVILFRGRGAPPGARPASAAQTPTAAPVPTGEAAVLSPMTTPPAAAEAPAPSPTAWVSTSKAQARLQPTRPPTAAPRAAAAARATPIPAPAAEPPSTTSTTSTARQAWLDRAARDQERANADKRNHFTIQLELACETSTLVDAWKHSPSGTLWVQTTSFGGRTCFRVLWGRYATKEAARRALASVPAFFSAAKNRPVVTAIR